MQYMLLLISCGFGWDLCFNVLHEIPVPIPSSVICNHTGVTWSLSKDDFYCKFHLWSLYVSVLLCLLIPLTTFLKVLSLLSLCMHTSLLVITFYMVMILLWQWFCIGRPYQKYPLLLWPHYTVWIKYFSCSWTTLPLYLLSCSIRYTCNYVVCEQCQYQYQ